MSGPLHFPPWVSVVLVPPLPAPLHSSPRPDLGGTRVPNASLEPLLPHLFLVELAPLAVSAKTRRGGISI